MPKKVNSFYGFLIPSTGESGIKNSWAECKKKVDGVVGARYKGFSTIVDAKKWLKEGALYGIKEKVVLKNGIYFDAGTGYGKGVEISVTDEKGTNLLHDILPKNIINHRGKHWVLEKGATNNFGELLALKYALQIAKKHNIKNIFGDSKLVIDYWSLWKVKKDVAQATKDLAKETAKLREAFEKKGGAVERVSGDINPADLGFHR